LFHNTHYRWLLFINELDISKEYNQILLLFFTFIGYITGSV